MANTDTSLQADFEQAVASLKSVEPKGLSVGDKLRLYGLYKQATKGNCKDEQTKEGDDEIEKLKRNAWRSNHGMSSNEAMTKYIELAVKLVPSIAKRATDRKEEEQQLKTLPQILGSPRQALPPLTKASSSKSILQTYRPLPPLPSITEGPFSSELKKSMKERFRQASDVQKRLSSLSGFNPRTESEDDVRNIILYERLRRFYERLDVRRLNEGIGDIVEWTLKYGEAELNLELSKKYGENLETIEQRMEDEMKAEESVISTEYTVGEQKSLQLQKTMNLKDRKRLDKLTKFLMIHDPELVKAGLVVMMDYVEKQGIERLNKSLLYHYGKTLDDVTDNELNEELRNLYGNDFSFFEQIQKEHKIKAEEEENRKALSDFQPNKQEHVTLNIAESSFFQDNLREFLTRNDPKRIDKAFGIMKEYARKFGIRSLNQKLTERYGENLATFTEKTQEERETEIEETKYKLLQYLKYHEPESFAQAYTVMVNYLEKYGMKALDEQLYSKYGAFLFRPNNKLSLEGKSLAELQNEDLPPDTAEMLELYYMKYDSNVVVNGGVERVLAWTKRNGYNALNRKLQHKYNESLQHFVDKRNKLKGELNRYYANVDPNKSEAEIERVLVWSMKNGVNALNQNLREKYGVDLSVAGLKLQVKF